MGFFGFLGWFFLCGYCCCCSFCCLGWVFLCSLNFTALLYRVLQILAAIRCNQSECKLWISSCFKALVRTDICKPAELGILCIPTITHFVLWKVQRLKIIKALISLAITRDFVCVLYCMPNQKSYLGAILCCRFKSRLMLLSSGFTDR